MKSLDSLISYVETGVRSSLAIEVEQVLETEIADILGQDISNITDPAYFATGDWLYRSSLSQEEIKILKNRWGASDGQVRYGLCNAYINIAVAYRIEGGHCSKHGLTEAAHIKLLHAERCCEKALDMQGISLNNVAFLPSNIANSYTYAGLYFNFGAVKFLLGKYDESRKYLNLCLNMRPNDEFSKMLQKEAYDFYQQLP